MQLYASIRKLIKQTSGLALERPSEFDALSESILAKTGERLSVNTLKRLFGTIEEVNPTTTTLTIIAHYLDFPSWQSLVNELEDANSVFQPYPNATSPKELPTSMCITVGYSPNREIVLKVLPTGQCEVVKVNKGKLQMGDILDIDTIVLHAPFIVKNVMRSGVSLGAYTGGQEGGVLYLELRWLDCVP